MFCPNCGTQLPDEAAFCGNCGTRINNQPAPQSYQAQPYQAQPTPMSPEQMYAPYAAEQAQPAPKKNRLPLLLGLIGGVVVIALLMVFLLGGSGSGSPEGVAEKFFTAVLECDEDSAEECIHPEMWSDIGGDFSELESMMSMFSDSITIEVKGSENVTDYGKEDVQELLDEYGIDEDLGEIYHVEVAMTISFMGVEQTETNDVVVAEIDGTYYLINVG